MLEHVGVVAGEVEIDVGVPPGIVRMVEELALPACCCVPAGFGKIPPPWCGGGGASRVPGGGGGASEKWWVILQRLDL